MSEFLYPLMQGYDSVAIEADVELGGTDQKYNLLMGRDIQQALRPGSAGGADDAAARRHRRRRQDERKSLGNYIGIDDPPAEMFGKVDELRDELMPDYYRLALESDTPPPATPTTAKREFARRLVERWHDAEAAAAAEAGFDRQFKQGTGGRRTLARAGAARRRPVPHAGASRRAASPSLSVRGAPADRAGRGAGGRRRSLADGARPPARRLEGAELRVGRRFAVIDAG